MGGSDLGCVVGRGGGDGGRSGSDMAPRGAALGLRFKGGRAFAEEFGLTAVVSGSAYALPACRPTEAAVIAEVRVGHGGPRIAKPTRRKPRIVVRKLVLAYFTDGIQKYTQ